jgi:hypothetical protein
MAQFLVVHTFKKSLEEYAAFATQERMAEFAKAMAAGQFPAKCVKTWDSLNYGQADYMFCLWEGGSAGDVQATIDASGLSEYITSDVRPVDELDWATFAQAAG